MLPSNAASIVALTVILCNAVSFLAVNNVARAQSLPITLPSPSPSSSPTTTELIFTVDKVTAEPFELVSPIIPVDVCPASSVTYTRVIRTLTGPLRVPHSTIIMDGQRCGNLSENATLQELWVDPYLELVPIEFLLSEDAAYENDALGIYNRLFTQRPYTRSFFNHTVRSLQSANASQSSVILVGLERYANRRCGNSIELPVNTFVFMGMFDAIGAVSLRGMSPFDESVSVGLHTPFHLTFAIPPDEDSAGILPEYVCAFERATPTPTPREPDVRMCVAGGALIAVPAPRALGGSITTSGKEEETDNDYDDVGGDGLRFRYVPVERLRAGDAVVGEGGSVDFVIAFSHAAPDARPTSLVAVWTKGGDSDGNSDGDSDGDGTDKPLLLSPGHLLLRADGTLVAARHLRLGDALAATPIKAPSSSSPAAVVVVRLRHGRAGAGLFNVHTLRGALLAQGVLVSCYTEAARAAAAHALLAPVRAGFRAARATCGAAGRRAAGRAGDAVVRSAVAAWGSAADWWALWRERRRWQTC